MNAVALDIEQADVLIDYLHRTGKISAGEQPAVAPLAGGVSNRTVLLSRANGESWVIKQALAKLRVEVDWYSNPQRIHREALGLRWLEHLAPPDTITPLIFEDHEHHLLAMQAVPQPHQNWKTLLLQGQLEQDHVQQFATLLANIHRQAYQQRAEIYPLFADREYFESLRLEPYYGYAGEQVPEAKTFLQELIDTTKAQRLTLVHGDYSPKNVLVYKNRLMLLDHEVIHFGDPGFDLGFACTHLLSKAHHLTAYRQEFLQATQSFWSSYSKALQTIPIPWQAELEQRAVQHTLACLLARVAGRSPLEYLTAEQRERQSAIVCELISSLPATFAALIDLFSAQLNQK